MFFVLDGTHTRLIQGRFASATPRVLHKRALYYVALHRLLRFVSFQGRRPGNLRYTPIHKAGSVPVKNLTFDVHLLGAKYSATAQTGALAVMSIEDKADFQQKTNLAHFFHREINE